MTTDDKERILPSWHVFISSVDRKEQIEKVEEKERLQKEKEEKEKKEAELAAQQGKGDAEEKTDDNEKVEESSHDEGAPEVSQHDENPDETTHHDEIGNYKDYPSEEVSSSLVNWNRFARFHLCIFLLHLFNKIRSQTMKDKLTKPFFNILVPFGPPAHSWIMRSWNKILKFQYARCLKLYLLLIDT